MPSRTFSSSLGTKLLVGLTGAGLLVYLVVHIAGNLVVFLGPDAFNTYAAALSGNPAIRVIEVGLLLVFLVHIVKALAVTWRNRQARPVAYAMTRTAGAPSRKTFASTTMALSGIWLLAFLIIHVRAFRFGAHHVTGTGIVDLYRIEMEQFASPLTVGFYVLSMLIVGSHLWHGASSTLQTLGLDHPRWTPRAVLAGRVLAAVIAAGFILIALWAHFEGGARA